MTDSSKDSDSEAIEMLTNGFLNLYEPHINTVQKNVLELIDKQNKIEVDLVKEIEEYSDKTINEMQTMINDFSIYKDKLQIIKKQMVAIHHRATNLKKRALYVQEFKQKELASRIAKRQHEENLIGKSSTSLEADTLTSPGQ